MASRESLNEAVRSLIGIEQTALLEDGVSLSRRQRCNVRKKGSNESANRWRGPTNVATRAPGAKADPIVDSRLPFVVQTLRALPPDTLVTPWQGLVRGQMFIPSRMPFGGEFWKLLRQRVRDRDPPSGAERTVSFAARPRLYRRGPLMFLIVQAPPPGHLVTPRQNVFRRQLIVSGWMPLCGDLGEARGQGIGEGGTPALTRRTIACALDLASYRSLPFVTRVYLAAPPNQFVAG